MIKNTLIILTFLLGIWGCESNLATPTIPQADIDLTLLNGDTLQSAILNVLSGIYTSENSNSNFGDKFVLKSNKTGVSVFCKKNTAFMIFETRIINSEIIFAGYWRYAQGYQNGFIKMTIDKISSQTIMDGKLPENFKITGEYYEGDQKKYITLSYLEVLKNEEFLIIGHRGGGRNSDRHPASENSIKMIEYSEKLGANGVEIDVQSTSDGVLVIFHDVYMSNRLINEDGFIGKISDYTFQQIRSFCTLKNGEKIPTLEEALDFIVNHTNHKFVWLDTKSQGIIPNLAEIQNKYSDLAKQKNRQIEILIGIPTNELCQELLETPNYQSMRTVCELNEDKVLEAGSIAWGPRWSLGLLTERITNLHTYGKKVYVWTLDEPKFIKPFLNKSYFDGILTNYPTVVAYEFYAN
jgi:glycerophosphoryl diester phosphodiesterase